MKRLHPVVFLLVASGCSLHGVRGPGPAAPARSAGAKEMVASTIEDPTPHRIPVIVGVLPFRNDTADAGADRIGGSLADEFSMGLASDGGIKVVERQRIKAALDELYFSDAFPVDEATAVKVGKLLGANVLALGSFSRIGGEAYLTVRLVKVETGEVIVGASEKGAGLDSLHGSVRRATDAIVARLRGRL